MDNLDIAKALFGQKPQTASSGGQTTTAYGTAVSDSVNGSVRVNLGGDTESIDDDQSIEVDTTFAVFEGDEVIVSLVGADGTGKAPCVIGVVGRGDQQQTEINSVTNYVWNDANGLHVSTNERSVLGANILLDSDSLDIRNGNSNSEADQTVYASFGREVTVGSRAIGSTVGQYSQVFGNNCIASGDYSHADGTNTQALGYATHAEGAFTKTGTYAYAHAEGWGSIAGGYASHAQGEYCSATGECSHAEGQRTTADSNHQHVQGKYNISDSIGTYADIIGNGVNNAPSNAYNLDWNGNAEFKGEVYVGGCTPNGETPYPVVRYNTSASKSEYYNGSSWAKVPGGGVGAWTELWTNSAPSSDFSAQTVPLDLSGYTWIAIIAAITTSGTAETTHLVRVGSSVVLSVPNLGGTQYFYKREASVTANGITFSTGYRNNTGTSGTSYCIPVAIYGVSAEYNLDWKTFSGALINFTTLKAHAIQSAVVNFSASQDLNGYDKPWAGGAGKNKYGGGLNQYSVNNVITDVMSLSAGTYTFSVERNNNISGIYVRNGTTPASPELAKVYNAKKITFTLSEDYASVIIQLYSAGVSVSEVSHLQLELGSTQTEWMPYSNICPISGWSDIEIYRETQYDAGATPYVTVNLGGTQYGGNLEAVSGTLTLTHGYIASYNGEVLPSTWLSDRDEYAVGTTPTTGAEVVYELASPTTTYLTPQTITALQGANAMWSNVGNITVVARGE